MVKKPSKPENLFRALFTNTNDAVFISDLNGTILDANKIACDKLGYQEEEIHGIRFKELCAAESAAIVTDSFNEIQEKKEVAFDYHHLEKNGHTFPAKANCSLIEYNENHAILCIVTDTSEKEDTKLEIEEARIAAEVANRARSEFLATMSHELRTPLNSIIGFSELLIDCDPLTPDDRQKKYVANIHKSGKHLLDLINDILDLSKIEAGKVKLSPEIFEVQKAISEVTTVASPLAAKSRIELNIDSRDAGEVLADKGKFKQTLYNLLNNAIKFTPEGGKIELTAEKKDGELQVSIRDSGVGIAPDDMEKIFKPFVQLDSSADRKYGGTGLGLALVKKFVDLHEGRVSVQSEVGKGSTFSFTIPDQQTATETNLAQEKEAFEPEIPITSENKNKNSTILVAEDEDDARELLTATLLSLGYDVVEVDRGDRVMEAVKKVKPFAITTDIMMPGKDGWQVLRELKEDEETKDIPVIMISVLDQCYNNKTVNAEDYFVKPVDREDLLHTLERFRHSCTTENPVILVIDDNSDDRELIVSILKPEGYEIIEARGGKEGIELAKSEKPCLITLDLMMPEVSGFDVIETLKAEEETANIPILVCTAKELTSDNNKMLRENVTVVLNKGKFNHKELIDLAKELSSLHIA